MNFKKIADSSFKDTRNIILVYWFHLFSSQPFWNVRGVFRNLSNIFSGTVLQKIDNSSKTELTAFSKKLYHVWQNFKYASERCQPRQWPILKTNMISYPYNKSQEADTRSSSSQIFFKISVLKKFVTFTGKHLCWSLFLVNL